MSKYVIVTSTLKISKEFAESYYKLIELRARFMLTQPGCIKLEYFQSPSGEDTLELFFTGKWTSLKKYHEAHDRLEKSPEIFELITDKFGEYAAHAFRVLKMNKFNISHYKPFAVSDDDKNYISMTE
ncbi:antibiotic biosynthesis monooxygenase [Fangia hongkongensis]|uniref:antibiotic biosynthesis monooxygenase n=1 Tax=Fangia hongkongensis TaxID=270495 RepID=UPI000373510E|nr:antibiotic biosynthesis monooxygenase [Fangia hongkongensis]MBK2125722.1 antibiotic biosynthesis monooxygenase [Fangia hongkongensis]